MAVIENLRRCTQEELEAQIRYLEQTPVRGLAALLRAGTCDLSAGHVRSVASIGGLKTEFGELGPLRPPSREGARKFLVSEVWPALEATPGADDAMHTAIARFMRKDEYGDVDYNITLVLFDGEVIVKDGNKRTIAFYERRRTFAGSIEFPVFVVDVGRHAG